MASTWYIFFAKPYFLPFYTKWVSFFEVVSLRLKAWIGSLLALVSLHGSRTRVILSSFLLYVLFCNFIVKSSDPIEILNCIRWLIEPMSRLLFWLLWKYFNCKGFNFASFLFLMRMIMLRACIIPLQSQICRVPYGGTLGHDKLCNQHKV